LATRMSCHICRPFPTPASQGPTSRATAPLPPGNCSEPQHTLLTQRYCKPGLAYTKPHPGHTNSYQLFTKHCNRSQQTSSAQKVSSFEVTRVINQHPVKHNSLCICRSSLTRGVCLCDVSRTTWHSMDPSSENLYCLSEFYNPFKMA
jgi:hypothetical protein